MKTPTTRRPARLTAADDDRALAGALRNLRAAADVLGACDAALGLGSAAEMAVAS